MCSKNNIRVSFCVDDGCDDNIGKLVQLVHFVLKISSQEKKFWDWLFNWSSVVVEFLFIFYYFHFVYPFRTLRLVLMNTPARAMPFIVLHIYQHLHFGTLFCVVLFLVGSSWTLIVLLVLNFLLLFHITHTHTT